MPTRLLRRHPQITKDTITRVPVLSLSSSRGNSENIEGLRRVNEGSLQYGAITMFNHVENDTMVEEFNPFMRQGSGILGYRDKTYVMGKSHSSTTT
jgi:hypothetical protein